MSIKYFVGVILGVLMTGALFYITDATNDDPGVMLVATLLAVVAVIAIGFAIGDKCE